MKFRSLGIRYIITGGLGLALSIGSYSLYDMYKKLELANGLADNLKMKNLSLTNENKQLKTKNTNLTKKNNQLVKREQNIKKKISQRHKRLTNRNLMKIRNKFATAGTKMTPVVGIGLIAGATAYDINEYCNDINEMQEFENELFGNSKLIGNNEELCGVNVEKRLTETGDQVQKKFIDAVNQIKNKSTNISNDISSYLGREVDDISSYYSQIWNNNKD